MLRRFKVMIEDTWTCHICGLPHCSGFGNNPEPFGEYEQRCCDDCNEKVVIPVRILSMSEKAESRAKAKAFCDLVVKRIEKRLQKEEGK
jgi:hypothetical protein